MRVIFLFIIGLLITGLGSQSLAKSRKTALRKTASQSLVKDFKTAVNLKDGYYVVAQGMDTACMDGDLELISVKDHLSLLFGGKLLITEFDLDEKSTKYSEDGCEHQVNTSRKGLLLTSLHTKICGKNTTVNKKNIEFKKPGSIGYTITFTKNGGAPTVLKCELAVEQ